MLQEARDLLSRIEEELAHEVDNIDGMLTCDAAADIDPLQARALIRARDAMNTTREILLDTLAMLTGPAV